MLNKERIKPEDYNYRCFLAHNELKVLATEGSSSMGSFDGFQIKQV